MSLAVVDLEDAGMGFDSGFEGGFGLGNGDAIHARGFMGSKPTLRPVQRERTEANI